jgi:transposase InsO family protein
VAGSFPGSTIDLECASALNFENGKEVAGSFQKVSIEREISHIYSALCNPQQNEKCERFWGTIKMSPNADDVLRLIAEPMEFPCFGLPQIQGTRGMGPMTPHEVWSDISHQWRNGIDPIWSVDGVSIPFP